MDGVIGGVKPQQRRTLHTYTEMPRIKARIKLLRNITHLRVQFHFLNLERGFSQNHLHRLRETFPQHRGTQNVVPIHHRLQGAYIPVQPCAAVEAELHGQQVRIPFSPHQMMKENPLLQRRQRIDVLHVGRAARHRVYDLFDLLLG